jgi:hypothetical protein
MASLASAMVHSVVGAAVESVFLAEPILDKALGGEVLAAEVYGILPLDWHAMATV